MIRIVALKRGRPRTTYFCPWVFCDFCHLRIADARGANFLFHVEVAAESHEVFHLHKGQCTRAFEHERGGFWYWGELSRLPLYLATNTGLKARYKDKTLFLPNEPAVMVAAAKEGD